MRTFLEFFILQQLEITAGFVWLVNYLRKAPWFFGVSLEMEVCTKEFHLCFFVIVFGNSFEHDFVENESGADQKDPITKHLDIVPANPERGNTVWNAKVNYPS